MTMDVANVGDVITEMEVDVANVVPVQKRTIDEKEEKPINTFLNEGCGCHLVKGEPCFRLFSKQHYESMRNSCFELDQDALDFLLIGQIMATSGSEEGAAKDRSGHKGFYHLSKKVCTTDLKHSQ